MRKTTTDSPSPLSTYEVLGTNLRIHFEEELITIAGEAGESDRTGYRYKTGYSVVTANRDELAEAVIRASYSTYGAEIACIQNGGADQEAHQQRRAQAKALADGWLLSRGRLAAL